MPLKWPKEWGGKEPWVWTLNPARDELLAYWGEKIDPPTDWPAGIPCYVTRLGVLNLRDGTVRTLPAPAANTKDEVCRTNYTGIAWR